VIEFLKLTMPEKKQNANIGGLPSNNQQNESTEVHVSVAWERDLIFTIKFGGLDIPGLPVDETNKEEDEMVGVTPGRLLASAVASCLSSSFLFCMSKRGVALDSFTAAARATTGRDPDGRLRVQEIAVDLVPRISNSDALKRLVECKKVFEKFCTVTESVRKGIKVVVNVKDS
jgi:organic hydroperoxide reductase OsmC/OhrA